MFYILKFKTPNNNNKWITFFRNSIILYCCISYINARRCRCRRLAMNAFEYLTTLPIASVDRLFSDPWACQAVFQSLPSLGQQIVIRMLFTHQAVSQESILSWVQESTRPAMVAAMEKLSYLRVLQQCKPKSVVLNNVFQQQLQMALCQGGSPWEQGRQKLPTNEKPIAAPDLEHYARTRWDAVLHFMVLHNRPASKNIYKYICTTIYDNHHRLSSTSTIECQSAAS
jgi:hypothetical protein